MAGMMASSTSVWVLANGWGPDQHRYHPHSCLTTQIPLIYQTTKDLYCVQAQYKAINASDPSVSRSINPSTAVSVAMSVHIYCRQCLYCFSNQPVHPFGP